MDLTWEVGCGKRSVSELSASIRAADAPRKMGAQGSNGVSIDVEKKIGLGPVMD